MLHLPGAHHIIEIIEAADRAGRQQSHEGRAAQERTQQLAPEFPFTHRRG